MHERGIVATLDMGGQPDSVAVSPDGRYAAVVIENERDEELFVDGVEGGLPQLPSGFLQIVDLVGHPMNWTTRQIDLSGLADIAPEDAEAEYVDINENNIAAVTLQENNHILFVNLETGRVVNHYSTGAVALTRIDTVEDDVIRLTDSLQDVKREPDALAWVNRDKVATANEGDFEGGSRGFSLFHRRGGLKWDSGNSYEHIAVRHGHYPESRSENKGAEPEGAEFGRFGDKSYLFIGSERVNFIAVYRVNGGPDTEPKFIQLLPVTNGPEGLKAIPERNLFVVSSEVDDPAGLVRIGRYSPKSGKWGFYSYPLDQVESPAGGWIGLSEVTALGQDRYAVIERDNQRGLEPGSSASIPFHSRI
jgi:hypothetical protein